MKIFLFVVLVLFCIVPANAQIVNGDFSDGLTGWDFNVTSNEGNGASFWRTQYYTGGGYYYHSATLKPPTGTAWIKSSISQSVDLTGYNILSSRGRKYFSGGSTGYSRMYVDDVYTEYIIDLSWPKITIDISGLTGFHTIKSECYANGTGTGFMWVFDYQLEDYEEPPNFITWTTYPPDSWQAGNYSTLIIAVPDAIDFDFYYKTPSTEYIKTPIQKSFFGRYFNVSEGCFYQDYLKTCYHPIHGNYSAKLVIDGSVSSETAVYVPYFDPNIKPPDVITIPIPDIYVDPPQWDIDIPPAYENVTWLNNYTVFWNGVGNSINYTLYSTVGLLFIPLDMLNNSVSAVHTYAVSASGMVSGFEHCAIIVKVGWDLIPPEMQTLFAGAAALGLVLFLYHRRT